MTTQTIRAFHLQINPSAGQVSTSQQPATDMYPPQPGHENQHPNQFSQYGYQPSLRGLNNPPMYRFSPFIMSWDTEEEVVSNLAKLLNQFHAFNGSSPGGYYTNYQEFASSFVVRVSLRLKSGTECASFIQVCNSIHETANVSAMIAARVLATDKLKISSIEIFRIPVSAFEMAYEEEINRLRMENVPEWVLLVGNAPSVVLEGFLSKLKGESSHSPKSHIKPVKITELDETTILGPEPTSTTFIEQVIYCCMLSEQEFFDTILNLGQQRANGKVDSAMTEQAIKTAYLLRSNPLRPDTSFTKIEAPGSLLEKIKSS